MMNALSLLSIQNVHKKSWMKFQTCLLFFVCLQYLHGANGFVDRSSLDKGRIFHLKQKNFVALHAKTKSKRKQGGGSGSASGLKGFGSGSKTSKKGDKVYIDQSKEAIAFYDFMEQNGAGDNLKRAGLGYFPLPDGGKIRGIVALKDIKKGDAIIRIPYEAAVNLGQEGGDPTKPAVDLLSKYCETLAPKSEGGNVDKAAYFRMLPGFMSEDCLGSTDFYSDEALSALQAPLVVDETIKRKERAKSMFEEEYDSLPSWIDGSPLTEEHLRWAVWIITSRILTVEGATEDNLSYRLLIPFLDMCNHDRSSPHILTGRAIPGGELKVVAGVPVKKGEQINICYGGGVAGNDRFIQDYGFLDSRDAFDIVAQQLMGKKKLVEGDRAGRTISSVDREANIEMLRQTKMNEDVALLEKENDPSLKSAISYRLGVKKALSKYMTME